MSRAFSALALALAACRGDGPPAGVLPRILDGEGVRLSLQTRSGAGEREFVVETLRARATHEAGCGPIARVELGGWMDSDRDGERDPGEVLPRSLHPAPGGAADEVLVTGVPLELPAGRLADFTLEIGVLFATGKRTEVPVEARW